MKVIDIIEATQMRSVGDLTSDTPKQTTSNSVPAAVAGASVALPAGSAVDKNIKKARRLNRRFKGEALLKTAVARVLPRVSQTAAFKAIPYAGLAAGFWFGAKSALKGDYMGAALEVATSLPWVGLVSAAGGISIIVAREVYNDIYEDPADPKRFLALEDDLRDDPEGTWARIKQIAGYVKSSVENNIEDARDEMERKSAVMKDVQAWNDEQRKSVSKPDDIKWASAATGNVPQARKALKNRQATGQEYK